MFHRRLSTCAVLLLVSMLLSCGGGSTVTAVSITADPAQVDVRSRSTITARADASVTGNTQGERVTFSIRHNETGAELDIINDRLDANGEARAIYRAGGIQGVDTVEASFGSGARATVTIRVGDAVVLGNLRLEAFSDTGTGIHTAWRIRATVTDSGGFPAPSQSVVFNTNNGRFLDDSGATPNVTVTVPTNNAGIAEARLDLSGTTGGATVFATVGGLSSSIRVGSQTPAGGPPVPTPQ